MRVPVAARTSFLVLSLYFAPCVVAQQSTASSTSAAEITIRGCITGENRYTFMQASTGAEYALSQPSSQETKTAANRAPELSSVRGKLVEVTGNEYAPKSGELPTLEVRKIRVVGDQCPIHPGKSHASNPNRNQAAPTTESPATPRYSDPGTETQTPPNINNPNIPGDTGAPSPGTGNPSKPPR